MQNTAIILQSDQSTLTFIVDTSINKCVKMEAQGNVFQQLKRTKGEAHAKYTELLGEGLNSMATQKAVFEYLKAKKGKTPKW